MAISCRKLTQFSFLYSVVRRCIPIHLIPVLPQQFFYNFWTPNSSSLIPVVLRCIPILWFCYSESESELLYDWRFTANQFDLAKARWDSRPVILFFQLKTCGYSPYVTSCLTIGWACRLLLLLALTSAVILRSESSGTHDHILLSQIRDSPNLEGQLPVFISARNRLARLYPHTPRHWVPFSSPSTTRMIMLEGSAVKSKSHFEWQSVSKSWCRAPSVDHEQMTSNYK
jgi:hypothetical protein